MSKNKSFYNSGTLLLGAGLLAGYLIYRKSTEAKEKSGTGSLGGTDDLLENQGFDVDPNSVPEQPQSDPYYFVITPDGQVSPNNSNSTPTSGGSGIPSNVPLASTGTGSLFQDAAMTGGAIGTNILLPSIAKRINKLVDTKYISDAVSLEKQTPFNKFIRDPYGINDLAVSKAEKAGTREVAELAIDKSGKTVLKTVPKWAKGVKTVANFIPLVDIPIGAGLDVYFARYEEDPSKKIDWWSAIKANTAGELAQLGITGAAAAAGTVVPVAGNIAGGVGGFIVGTGADIAATEGAYAAMGKTSLFIGDTKVSNAAVKTNGASYDISSGTYTSSSGVKQSVAASNVIYTDKGVFTSLAAANAAGSTMSVAPTTNPFTAAVSNPFTSSGSSGSSSSSSSSAKSSSSSATKSTAPSTNVSSSTQSSAAKTSSAPVATAPKVSVVSKVTSTVSTAAKTVASTVSNTAKSVASKVSSFFGGGKKK